MSNLQAVNCMYPVIAMNATNRWQSHIATSEVWITLIYIIYSYIILTIIMGKTVLRQMKIFACIIVHYPETIVVLAHFISSLSIIVNAILSYSPLPPPSRSTPFHILYLPNFCLLLLLLPNTIKLNLCSSYITRCVSLC